ncbi:ABC transporter permease [Bacteroidota bacterium]
MFKNYLKTTFRIIRRNKTFSFINISGLVIGITSALLIYVMVNYEFSYDKFNKNFDNIYRVWYKWSISGSEPRFITQSFYPLANLLKSECPEIEEVSRFQYKGGMTIMYKDKNISGNLISYADPGFLKIFSIDFLIGDPQNALSDPQSIIVSESFGEKIFGDTDPMGKVLNINNEYTALVTGVYKDHPKNSHFRLDCIMPYVTIFGPGNLDETNWGGNPLQTFVLLNKKTNATDSEEKINNVLYDKGPFSEAEGMQVDFGLQAMKRIHLFEIPSGGPIEFIKMLSVIAIVILIIACFNFMNLSTARASARAKEVGIRKVAGGSRYDLIRQFYGEYFLLTFIALVHSIVIAEFLINPFNRILGTSLSLNLLDPGLWIGIIGVFLITGIIAGSYPALLLSSFKPVKVLYQKGVFSSGAFIRKILVIFQFSISIILIISSIVVVCQFKYMINSDLGYNNTNIIGVRVSNDDIEKSYTSLRNQWLQIPGVENVTASAQNPYWLTSTGIPWWEGCDPENDIAMNWDMVHFDYIETFGMELVDGRSFSRDYFTDPDDAFIVNEKAVEVMGLEKPVGTPFKFYNKEGKIVGVVKNFNSQPLKNEITPLILSLNPDWIGNFFVRYNEGTYTETIESMKKIWDDFHGDLYMNHFNQKDIEINAYKSESSLIKTLSMFTLVAVLISCLGLFGLSLFTIEQRTFEIGVRKALGENILSIVWKFMWKFIGWILVSNIIALPIAWLIMRNWLSEYAFKMNLSWTIFILSCIISIVLGALTVLFQTIKAANTNPAITLRHE